MSDYVILTTKGAAVFREDGIDHGRVIFAGAMYNVPLEVFDPMGVSREESEKQVQVNLMVHSCVQILQNQRIKKGSQKKRKNVEVVFLSQSASSGSITKKSTHNTVANLILSGITQIFKTNLFISKPKKAERVEYTEGEFSLMKGGFRKTKTIEPLSVFEVERLDELFECKYNIVLNEGGYCTPPKHTGLLVKSESVESDSDNAQEVLKHFEKNFYTSEFAFILGLARSKVCIKEVGKWLYNTEHNEIFSNLQNIIEMLIAAFTNTILRTLAIDAISADVIKYISADTSVDYANLIYKSTGRSEAMDRIIGEMERLEAKKQVGATMEQVNFPTIAYFEELSKVIYSHEFIQYIESVEENITLYKKKYTSEIMAAERKFSCNLCFLFVDVYHRIIKYKMYIEEAMTILRKKEHLSIHRFSREIEQLSVHAERLSEILKATERCKKIKTLKAAGIQMPDCIDDFIEMFELSNGYVVITKENLMISNKHHVMAVVDKKEVLGCVPTCSDDYSTVYIDLAVSSLYPPVPNFVVDSIDGVRVHWIRLNFKWDGYQDRFVSSFRYKTVSTIPGLEMRLRDTVTPIKRTVREKMDSSHVQNSHRRMLVIREQRKLVLTSDLYTYGTKNRLSEPVIFKIKSWIDKALETYAESIKASPSLSPRTGKEFERDLVKDILKVIKYHHPMVKVPYTQENNEFSRIMEEEYSLSACIPVIVEYLSYVFRILSPEDLHLYSASGIDALTSVSEMRNPTLSNDEFLELAIGCASAMSVPPSLTRNEFFLSLLIVRFFIIIAPDIQSHNFLSICAPFFIFHSKELVSLSWCCKSSEHSP